MSVKIERWKEPTENEVGDFVGPSRISTDWFRIKESTRSWDDAEETYCYSCHRYNELEALISELMDFREWVIENKECESDEYIYDRMSKFSKLEV